MSEKVSLGILIAIAVRVVALPPSNFDEAFVYVSLSFIIVAHWAFSAWLKVKETRLGAKETQMAEKLAQEIKGQAKETESTVKDLKTKINAITLRLGLQ